jgi:hypothetical protein
MQRSLVLKRLLIVILCAHLIMDNAFWIHHWMLYVAPVTIIGLECIGWVLE